MLDTIRVIQYGLGPIGCGVARHIVDREGLELVGGVDIDPFKVGEDVGEVIGLAHPLGFAIAEALEETLVTTGADLAVHTTSSYFDVFKPQIVEILSAGLDVVSSAEELSFPWLAYPEQAAEIDAAAIRAGKTVLATGVNPGFLMDTLPLALTSICQRVDRIEVTRVIDATTRRGPFQHKVGAGMTVAEFRDKMDAGRMGHVGLSQSVGMVFSTLGKKLVRYATAVEPILAEQQIETGYCKVQSGQVRGLRQVARAYSQDGEFMTLVFVAALGADEEGDTIRIFGEPDLEVTLKGTNGDLATVAILVNAIQRVKDARPGLVTMADLPIVTAW